MDIALVTCEPMPALAAPEHQRITRALEQIGHRVRSIAWTDAQARWEAFDLAIVRSTWDYIERREAFLQWARSVPRLANPSQVLEWNSHKAYLRELEAKG